MVEDARRDAELAREQRYVDRLYTRLDAVQQEAQSQLTAVRRGAPGGTHQARSERDAMARIFEDRIAQLREVDDRLVFGRLQTEADELRYIGRIGLRDDDLAPLLLDWRVPQASAFYQATAATRLGVRARRHLTTRARTVTGIEDEVFDTAHLAPGVADAALSGETALMAALTAQRTGRMHDIVSTIQAEQDRIIRSDLAGILVVQGGPGTGKTAVALHRAAYLLYTHRDRLARSGVLIVGPSRSFLQYIEQVLPSLGETGVVLSTVGQLFPGVDTAAEDPPDVAELKGAPRMAALLGRAVRARQAPPVAPQTIMVNGDRLEVPVELVAGAVRRAQQSRKPHNVARVAFVKDALSQLTLLWEDLLRSNGSTVYDEDRRLLREDLRTAADVRVLLNTAWLPLTPQKLLADLYARPDWLRSLTPGWSERDRKLLGRSRDAPLTVSDVPLLDEAAELLGEADAVGDAQRREAKQQRKRDIENAEQAIRNMDVEGMVSAETLAAGFAESAHRLTTAERAGSDRSWTYGHVVVDEAQELSPMQWRLLRRRAPLRSFTIVGDIAQSASTRLAADWSTVLAGLAADFRVEQLTVNYRTPRRIADLADAVAREYGLPITPAESVRDSEWPVFRHSVPGHSWSLPAEPAAADVLHNLVAATLAAVREDRQIAATGTVAVIAPASLLDAVHQGLSGALPEPVGAGSEGLTERVTVLTPRTAKGLEFDTAIVVAPSRIVAEEPRGPAALYVSLTRPTQRLHLVELSP